MTYLTETEQAQSAFKSFIKSLPVTDRDEIETRAWENAFAAEVYAEYGSDLERWQVALSTAQLLADERGIRF